MNFENYINSADNELLRSLPPVLRARDFRLYLNNNKRLTDLWQFGGKAVLGHKPPNIINELKNAAERGLFTPLPHPAERRFLKALEKLFALCVNSSDYTFRIYSDKTSLLKALERAGINPNEVNLWRPFTGNKKNSALTKINYPVLPWPVSPDILVINKSVEKEFPQSDLLPPAVLVPAARAIYNLIAAGDYGGRPRYIKIEKALAANNSWKKDGIYLFRYAKDENHSVLWRHFLEHGFLLPPSPAEPAILPGSLSKGEETELAALLSGS